MTWTGRPEKDPARELVDVIDEEGAVLRQATRAEIRADNLLHRSVFIAVTTSKNEVVVHQRADWKDLWPSRWDVCFGGVVDAGERVEEAAVRELHEEAGLVVTIGDLTPLGEGRYEDEQLREIGSVFHLVTDEAITFADGEVVATDLVPLAELRTWLDDHPACPDSRLLVVPLLEATS